MQGGGWCNNARACQFRKTSRRGSSDLMEKEIPFGGIMSSSPADNPGPSDCDDDLTSSCIASRSVCRALLIDQVRATDFYNWNRVKIRYCDGASFAGEGFDKAQQTDHLPYNFSVLLLLDFSAVKLFIYHVVVFLIWWWS